MVVGIYRPATEEGEYWRLLALAPGECQLLVSESGYTVLQC